MMMSKTQFGIPQLKDGVFDLDNYHVYHILIQWTAGGIAETHVDMFSETTDGRGAYELLHLNYEGTDYRQTLINNARHMLNHAFLP
jgi:hypothetical protein